MTAYDVSFSLGDGLRPGCDRRRQRRGAVRRTAHAGRADADRLEARLPGDDRRPRPRADAHDQGEHGLAARSQCARSAVLHARAADHRHRARLRPHHQRHRRGDDRLVRLRHALLRHAQGTPRPAEQEGRQGRRDRLQDRRARRRPGQGPSRRAGCATTRCQQGPLRVPLGGPVQPRPRPRDRARSSTTRRLPQEGAEGRPLLLHVRPPLLLHEDHPGRARIRAAEGAQPSKK